jgi:hypothetical protein
MELWIRWFCYPDTNNNYLLLKILDEIIDNGIPKPTAEVFSFKHLKKFLMLKKLAVLEIQLKIRFNRPKIFLERKRKEFYKPIST